MTRVHTNARKAVARLADGRPAYMVIVVRQRSQVPTMREWLKQRGDAPPKGWLQRILRMAV